MEGHFPVSSSLCTCAQLYDTPRAQNGPAQPCWDSVLADARLDGCVGQSVVRYTSFDRSFPTLTWEFQNLQCVGREQFLMLSSCVQPRVARENQPANRWKRQKEAMCHLRFACQKKKRRVVARQNAFLLNRTKNLKGRREKPSNFLLTNFVT